MRPSYRPDIPPQPPAYRTQVLDPLGLVAGMCEAPGITEVIARAPQQDSAMRLVTVAHAVKAMVLNGLGFVNQQLSRIPHFLQPTPLPRLLAPGMQAHHLHDDTLGRALDTLYAFGVTALYSRMAATAAQRLGLAPTFPHLESTSVHVDGRDKREEAPDEQVVHMTHGSSRDHRPDRNQVMLELVVEHHAGIPVLMKPLSGNSNDTREFGQVVRAHMAQLHTPSNPTYLVADSALSRADNLHQLVTTSLTWITRVPATWTEAQEVLAQAPPETMASLSDGSRSAVVAAPYGDVAQRWVLIDSEPRRAQAQRTVDKQWLQQSEHEGNACKTLCRTACACAADAHQARTSLAAGLQSTVLHDSTVYSTPHSGQRGRPGPGAQPAQIISHVSGALASRLTNRQARIDQQSCCI